MCCIASSMAACLLGLGCELAIQAARTAIQALPAGFHPMRVRVSPEIPLNFRYWEGDPARDERSDGK